MLIALTFRLKLQTDICQAESAACLFYVSNMGLMQGKEVLVRQISNVLGSAPKLVVSRTDSLDKTPAKAR